MADLHIEDFYQDVAGILLGLYNSFPRPTTLFVSDLVGELEPDAFGVPAPRHLACFSAMLWLADEGFLRYTEAIRQEAIDQCCLTERAFVRLATPVKAFHDDALPPSIARQRATLAQQLRDARASQSSTHLANVVQHCFQSPA
ncbi:hypothetical protein [Halopseudomonas pelagia]|uniref:hypothetical protein n=1 Tax=Halopseudomonas pelagia TaxID=553151 RepID=UPI0003A51EDB|nr:hypothetical protein [Halopseudomonas pelagia]|tara:strand:+ start:692 stop:1120 length:429 start_codon:yes stop_codon:yes gene_type:complete